MLRSRSKKHPADLAAHVDAVVASVREQVPAEVLSSLVETGEVAGDDPEATTALLRRFAVAEKLDAHRAARRLAHHASWRREHLPNSRIPEDQVQRQIAQEKVFLQAPGRAGSPLLVIRVARHRPVKDIAEVERYVIFCLEAAARMCDTPANPDGKMWALFDLDNIKWSNLDAYALRCCFSTLQAAFPERVRCIYMVNSPLIFDSLWRIVSPFIDPTTRAKVQFLSGASATATLLEVLGPELLPKAYGGEAEEVLLHVAAKQWDSRTLKERAPEAETPPGNGNGNGSGGGGGAPLARGAESSVEEFQDACEEPQEAEPEGLSARV